MILPDNGKVVIIDNRIDDVKELMAALSAERVPFLYFRDENGEDLPSEPLDNIRLIFLDLLLVDDAKGQAAKKVIAPIAARLKRILKKDNGPYVLIYWSNKEAEYRAEFENEFNGGLKEYKPLLTLSLDKTHAGALRTIKTELEKVYSEKFGALNAFLFWESLVNKAAGDVVNEFAGFNLPGVTADQSLKNILYKLAKAVDEDGIGAMDDKDKMKTAFGPVNSALLDLIHSNFENRDWPNVTGISISGTGGDAKYVASINSRLHLRVLSTDRDKKALASGNIYSAELSEENRTCVAKILEGVSGTADNQKFILLDVTPPCDYAHKGKVQCVRLLPGVIFEFPAAGGTKIKTNTEYGYGQCPPFCLDGKIYGILFDFRYLRSQPVDEFRALLLSAQYRIGLELLTDIQAKLSRHINRPGIISIA